MSADDRLPQPDLFVTSSGPTHRLPSPSPLAERLRPQTFEEFVGQEHVLAGHQSLRQAIEKDQIPSLILWGPPGSGKTTLAHIIAKKTKAAFVAFSAVVSGVPELRAIIKQAVQRRHMQNQATILFVDEIHRFNKASRMPFCLTSKAGTWSLLVQLLKIRDLRSIVLFYQD